MLVLAGTLCAQEDTDIQLFDNIKYLNNGVRFDKRVQLTDAVGYDNQPAFSADGKFLFYTSIRDGEQADIYRYSLESGSTIQITDTPESEYSPTPLPDGNHLSVVKVEKDGKQRLWKVPILGKKKKQTVIAPKVDSVGYHCWINEHTLAVYILGKPATLRIIDLKTETETIVAHDIGRSMRLAPDGKSVTFTQTFDGKLMLVAYRISDGKTAPMVAAAPQSEDFVWGNASNIYMAAEGVVYQYSVGLQGNKEHGNPAGPGAIGEWIVVDSFPETRFFGPSRMAVSPDGRKWAIVFLESDASD